MNRHDLETARWQARESANAFGIPTERLNEIYGYEHSSANAAEPTLRVRTASFTATEEELEERRQNLAQPLNNDPLDSRGRPRRQKSIGRRLRDSFRLKRRSRSTSSERIRRHREDVEAQKAAGREYHSTFDLSDDDDAAAAGGLSPTVRQQQSEKEQLFSTGRLVVDLPPTPSSPAVSSPASPSSSSPPPTPHPNTSPAKYSIITHIQADPETPPPAYSEIEPRHRDQPIFTLSSSSSSSSSDEDDTAALLAAYKPQPGLSTPASSAAPSSSSSPLLDMEASSYYTEMMKKVKDEDSILGLKETLSSGSSSFSSSSSDEEEEEEDDAAKSPKIKKEENDDKETEDPLLPLLSADPRYQHLAVVTPKKQSPKTCLQPLFGGRHTPVNPSPLIVTPVADQPLAEIKEEEEEEEDVKKSNSSVSKF